MVSVKYENVKIAYDDFIAIKGVTLNVPDGEITTLLGPSGCGKSTLLRSLAGFVEPFEGKIFIGEKEVTILPPQRRNTAMIFQNYALWPHLSIFKNVEYGLKLRLKHKIVYSMKINSEGIIESTSYMKYGANEELLQLAEQMEKFVAGKNVKEVWNLTLEDLREPLDIPEIQLTTFLASLFLVQTKEANAKFLLGALRLAIRNYFEFTVKKLPDWLPEKKTREERKTIKTPLHLRFLWLTKPYFLVSSWRNRKAKYLDYKASKDSAFEFRREKVQEVLDLVHLADQIDKNPTELSGGQQQRIALARSIVVEPDVLLCDEPLSNLDAKLRKELRTEIRSIIKKIGMTAIYVTHDQAEALAISDRIAVMNIGFIEQYGTPTEVFTDPKTLFVGQFIGSSSTLNGKIVAPDKVELVGGETVKIVTKQPLQVGTEVNLIVRPEVISLHERTDSPIEFKIHTIEYLGTEVKITGTLKDDTIILVDFEEQTEKYSEMKVGDILTGYINPEAVFVFVNEKRVY